MGLSLGLLVETSVAILLAVTIGYCVLLNHRLKQMHADRQQMAKMVSDLVQATGLANAAIRELKSAAIDTDMQLAERLAEAEKFGADLAVHISTGGQLMEKIARITAAAKAVPETDAVAPVASMSKFEIEPGGRLQSALQQLAMRPGIGGKAA
jgi:hypothetical protein